MIGSIDSDFDPDNLGQCVTIWSTVESPSPIPSPTPSPTPVSTSPPSDDDVIDDDDDDGYYNDDDNDICEDFSSKFFLKYNWNTDVIVIKNCDFLASKSLSYIEKKCKNKVNYYQDPKNDNILYRPAQITCPLTCGSCGKCYQNLKTKFLHYKRGNGKEIIKRCSWLKNQNAEKKNKICNRGLNGLYPSALAACPVICGKVGCD